jgi:hypothetical protein
MQKVNYSYVYFGESSDEFDEPKNLPLKDDDVGWFGWG